MKVRIHLLLLSVLFLGSCESKPEAPPPPKPMVVADLPLISIEEMRKVLASNGFNFTASDYLRAVQQGNDAAVKYFLKAGIGPDTRVANGSPSAAMIAAENGFEPILEMLIQEGADVNATDGDNSTALHFAVRGNHAKIVEILLKSGARVNEKGGNPPKTPLEISLGGNYDPAITTLLHQYGAEPQTSDTYRTPSQISDKTLLQVITKREERELAKQLIMSPSTNLNEVDSNQHTALMLTAMMTIDQELGQELAEMLLRRGADPNLVDGGGYTALHIAVGNRYLEMSKILVNGKTDLKIKDKNGRTPLELAKANRSADIVAVLEQAGGR